VNLGGRVGRVRFELEDRVGRLLRKVDRERRVGRMCADDKEPARLVLVRGDQGEFGCDRAVVGSNMHFGGDCIVLIESVDHDRDGGVARLDVERRCGVERALDRASL